jgi:hypothetical protein
MEVSFTHKSEPVFCFIALYTIIIEFLNFTVASRTAAEVTVRDPLLARDYGALPGELAARSEHVDELYRSYKLSTRDMDLQPGPSYVSPYENSRSLYYGESLQRPVVARVRGPSVPVSSRYSFGPPS